MGRLRNIGRLRAVGVQQSSTDADAAAWAAAVTANSGTYSAATLAALSTLITSAKASGYWTKIAPCFNPMCGNQLAACLIQLKGGVWASATNNNFVSGDYTEATGLTGNGTTKYLDTGLIPSASLTANDTHIALYNRAASAVGGERTIGSGDASGFFQSWAVNSDGVFYSDQYNNTGGAGRVNSAVSAPYGLMTATRTASNVHVIYQGATSRATNATTGGALPTTSILVFKSRDGAGAPAGTGSAHPLASYSIGSGLSAADVTAYNTHMTTFQTSLARNV